jgi:hypothetical protein
MSETVSLFDSEADFRSAIDLTLALAEREIRIFDRNLARMQLHDSSHVAVLSAFLAGNRNRRLKIVLHDTAVLERDMPRLLALLRDHAHMIAVRRTPDHLRHLSDCWLLADSAHGTIRFHEDHPRGKRISASELEIRPWWQRFDALWDESEPCSPGAATGL